jgi:hypothetical protein
MPLDMQQLTGMRTDVKLPIPLNENPHEGAQHHSAEICKLVTMGEFKESGTKKAC